MFKSLKPLSPYLRKYRGTFAIGALCVLCNNGIWILFPIVIRSAVQALNTEVSVRTLARYALYLMGVSLAKGVFQYLTRWILIGVSREIEFDLRNDLFAHLEGLSYSFYQRTRTGDIMARMTNDLNAVRMLVGPGIMYTANTIVFTAVSLAFMLSISPKMTLFAFLPLPVFSIVVQYFGRQIHERFERIQAMFSDISARAQENFSGARLIRAYVQEEAEIELFERENEEYIGRSLRLVRLMGMLWPTLTTLLGVAIVIVLLVGGREVIQHRINVGDFAAFNTNMVQLTWPIIALGWVINIFQRGTASLGRIANLLSEEPAITDAGVWADGAPEEVLGEIEFRNLTFGYGPTLQTAAGNDGHAGDDVLHGVNLRVPAGTSLAIVGPTGSGKSTLVSLIPRIYDAAPGSVLIDGRPIREFPLEVLRRNIGFVPQETFLFSDTIRENIAFGAQDATEAEVRRAAEAANIAADIEGFPDGYNTLVGERGLMLSGGQKQRTAIARALIRNPRILVLDDALASVDTQTEDRILNHLREVMQGRTTIFISHRVSTVRNADRIAVLRDGKIVEYGAHDELIARNGYYTELHERQLLEEELEKESATV
ncbi:MAG TPA: ABC transporter ATP-binding protein [Candidatus Binatia bacterium]|jgi:ATP-binding cassette subfamily B protein|nr:ABC transporter ATP-binding protein [Candidatus Binatia bacterium]